MRIKEDFMKIVKFHFGSLARLRVFLVHVFELHHLSHFLESFKDDTSGFIYVRVLRIG